LAVLLHATSLYGCGRIYARILHVSLFLEEKKPSTPYLPVHCASLAASESLAILSHLFTLSFKGRLGDRGMYLLDSDSQIVSMVYDLVQALKLVWDPEQIFIVCDDVTVNVTSVAPFLHHV
jgi:hypothetical protein